MFIATAVVSALLAAAVTWSAIRKLSHDEDVVRSYARAGVPEGRLNYLAAILLAAAGGLLLGLRWSPIGIAAAGGLAVYLGIAVVCHIRHRDAAHMSTPLTLALVAVGLQISNL